MERFIRTTEIGDSATVSQQQQQQIHGSMERYIRTTEVGGSAVASHRQQATTTAQQAHGSMARFGSKRLALIH